MSNDGSLPERGWVSRRMCTVTSAYQRAFDDPITMRAGEELVVNGKEDAWNGNVNWIWVWCSNAEGKSGWVPEEYVVAIDYKQ